MLVRVEAMLADPFDRPTRLAASYFVGVSAPLEPKPAYRLKKRDAIGSSDE